MEIIKKIEFDCDSIEMSAYTNALSGNSRIILKAKNVCEDDIMESLNFEDVMNYYGVSAVCEWCEANR